MLPAFIPQSRSVVMYSKGLLCMNRTREDKHSLLPDCDLVWSGGSREGGSLVSLVKLRDPNECVGYLVGFRDKRMKWILFPNYITVSHFNTFSVCLFYALHYGRLFPQKWCMLLFWSNDIRVCREEAFANFMPPGWIPASASEEIQETRGGRWGAGCFWWVQIYWPVDSTLRVKWFDTVPVRFVTSCKWQRCDERPHPCRQSWVVFVCRFHRVIISKYMGSAVWDVRGRTLTGGDSAMRHLTFTRNGQRASNGKHRCRNRIGTVSRRIRMNPLR